uniref:FZ domain-containing protein n=1 Tax=Ditylenchus dipsaci TaxID=166011 RepID=A0A915D9G2_9BILA
MISAENRPSSPLILLLLLLLVLSVSTVNGYRSETKSKKCEPITIPLCQGIGYNMTSYPTAMDMKNKMRLVWKYISFIHWSREVCLEARKHCAPLMQQYGFKWPLTLQCDPLPKMADQQSSGQLCAAPPDTPDNSNPTVTQSNEVAVRHPVTKQYPVAPPELLGIDVLDRQCQCKCVLPFLSQTDLRIQSTMEDRQFLNAWISVWSGICLALSLFTVLTFLTDMARFPYPERPIFFLSLCQMMVSMGFYCE